MLFINGNPKYLMLILLQGMAAPMNPQRYEVYEERKDGEENLLAFPVHATCIRKLRQRLGAEPLDPRLLFQVFQTYGYLPNGRAQYLNIDYYGARNFIPGPTWVVQEGAERFVTSPDSSDRLRKWFPPVQATLPRANTEADLVPRFSAPRVKLPTEIVLQIMENLSWSDILHLRCTCKALYNVPIRGTFWKVKYHRELLPLLYDVPMAEDVVALCHLQRQKKEALQPNQTHDEDNGLRYNRQREETVLINWENLYRETYWDPTVANRRRIWRLCDQFISRYRETGDY